METTIKEITGSAFGWVIAYVLPGLLALYTISFWSTVVGAQLASFSQATSGVGVFLLGVLTCLLIGIELAAVRWVVYEQLLCKGTRLSSEDFARLQTTDNIAALRIVADEHYKYHQFWGGQSLVIPFFFWGVLHANDLAVCSNRGIALVALAILIEVVTVFAAVDSYGKYVNRARAVLKGAK